MRLFQHDYIKDELRHRGYHVDQDTTQKDMSFLLLFNEKVPYRVLCEHLGIEYTITHKRCNPSREIFLFYQHGKTLRFKSIAKLERFLQLRISCYALDYILDKKFTLYHQNIYFSFSPHRRDFSTLDTIQSSKFLLYVTLLNQGYSLPQGSRCVDIYHYLHLPFPKRYKFRELCSLFNIPHLFYGNRERNARVPIQATNTHGATLSFPSMSQCANYFQTVTKNISLSMQHNIGFPFQQTLWFFNRIPQN